jgi:hypothetical protein
VVVLDIHVLNAKLFRHLNRLRAVKLDERITGNPQLDIGIRKLIFLRLQSRRTQNGRPGRHTHPSAPCMHC